jgi:lysozyme
MDKVIRDLGNGLARVAVPGANAPGQEVHGVDLSVWQGDVDWSILSTKVHFAYIRAGYGNAYIDPQLVRNAAGAGSTGVPYGLYWYLKPDKDWRKHAESFANAYETYGGKLYPVFDLEENGGKNKTDLESWVKKCVDEFCRLTELDLVECATYTTAGFLNTNMPLTNWMKWTNLWVAHWTTAATPLIPNEWAIPGRTWKLWQYSSKGDGLAYGAQSKAIDLNRYNGSPEQFEDEFGVTLPKPEPEPLPEPVVPLKRVKVRADLVDYLNVRSQPSLTAQDLGDLRENSIVPVVEVNGDFYRIDGWIHRNYVQDV